MTKSFIYSGPQTAYDISFGQTFKQYKMEQREDGTFAWFHRYVVIGANGNSTNTVPEWKAGLINLTVEQARSTAARWVSNGCTRDKTRECGLENLEQVEKERAERRARREAKREAKRVI